MGQMAGVTVALVTTHDLNAMFADKVRTWRRLNRIRDERVGGIKPFENILAPSNPNAPPPRVQSLRFAAAELTRKVRWAADDPSRGDRRALLRWLTWVEMDDTPPDPTFARRTEAQKMVAALDYFIRAANAATVPDVTFVWNEDLVASSNGTFSITVTPPITSTTAPGIMAINIAVRSTDIYHTGNLGAADEDD